MSTPYTPAIVPPPRRSCRRSPSPLPGRCETARPATSSPNLVTPRRSRSRRPRPPPPSRLTAAAAVASRVTLSMLGVDDKMPCLDPNAKGVKIGKGLGASQKSQLPPFPAQRNIMTGQRAGGGGSKSASRERFRAGRTREGKRNYRYGKPANFGAVQCKQTKHVAAACLPCSRTIGGTCRRIHEHPVQGSCLVSLEVAHARECCCTPHQEPWQRV